MEASVFCTRCNKELTLDTAKYAYEDDDPYCEDCLDEVEAYWEGVYSDQNIDRARE